MYLICITSFYFLAKIISHKFQKVTPQDLAFIELNEMLALWRCEGEIAVCIRGVHHVKSILNQVSMIYDM